MLLCNHHLELDVVDIILHTRIKQQISTEILLAIPKLAKMEQVWLSTRKGKEETATTFQHLQGNYPSLPLSYT